MVKVKNNLDNICQEPPKKKRGRPRKIQENHNTINQKNELIINNENSEKVKKTQEGENEMECDDEIILHIPFNLEDLKEYTTLGNASDTKKSSQEEQNTNCFTIVDLSDNTDSNLYSDEYQNYNNESTGLIKKIKERDDQIRTLEETIKEYRTIINDSIMPGLDAKKMMKMDVDLIRMDDGGKIVLETTDISCWWCTEQFNSIPCFIPDKYESEKYHVFGCFCSYNCAAAYNIDMDDYKIWDRFSLIKRLHKEIYNNKEQLDVAPPRHCLQKFGGPLTLDEFRKSLIKNDKEYRFIMPPMVSIIPFIEQSIKDTGKWDKLKSSNPEDNLVLKRTKPLPNAKNTLFETMGIKIK
jgi:hypothetical protein